MRLSPHFIESEFRCPCCLDIKCHPLLIVGLEELREKIGKPIKINSGYRCPAHNAKVGGKPTSLHLQGHAADIAVRGMTGDDLYQIAKTIKGFAGLGVGARFLHVDVGPGPRRTWRY
jgi:uncharacterized protein YcbK (DUF882 family)